MRTNVRTLRPYFLKESQFTRCWSEFRFLCFTPFSTYLKSGLPVVKPFIITVIAQALGSVRDIPMFPAPVAYLIFFSRLRHSLSYVILPLLGRENPVIAVSP